jgi:UDP-2,3-diacylglucosamine pyrophosphatase LpxH
MFKKEKITKNFIKVFGVIVIIILLFVIYNISKKASVVSPFSNGGSERNMIVVISDIHLGANIAYAEIKDNLEPLEKMLNEIKESANVKELVIAGDLFDEWFVPADIDTYQGKDQTDFVKRIASTNKGVIDTLNSIIKEGNILVTYVPGNHDLTITAENVEKILPGIKQARDATQGLGTYVSADYPKIAIEHGHRYNFFCAPDPISNQQVAPGTILPPGYFYTRIAALHVIQRPTTPGDIPPEISEDNTRTVSQNLLYEYWKGWYGALKMFTIENKFNEKIIVTNINGFKGNYAVNDILPYQNDTDKAMYVNLYDGIQDTWKERQELNSVAVEIPAEQAIENVSKASETDFQAKNQYFLNKDSNKRIVIFGHTHDAKIITSYNYNGEKSIYANSGTWIDKNNAAPTSMNFIVITPQNSNIFSKTFVRLYRYNNGSPVMMDEDSVRY